MEKDKCCLPKNWKEPRVILAFLAIVLLAAVIIFSILRDRFVNDIKNQVTVTGRGEVIYQPDVALINLGVKIDKAATAQEALSKMNEKINAIIGNLSSLGLAESNITTQNYSLYPQYDYEDGSSKVSGYNANQQIVVKVEKINENRAFMEDVINKASEGGANQVLGIDFKISNINDLRQKARITAIKDARSKANELAKAAGIKKLGPVVSWYESVLDGFNNKEMAVYEEAGFGASRDLSTSSAIVPAGDEKIVIEMNVIYETE